MFPKDDEELMERFRFNDERHGLLQKGSFTPTQILALGFIGLIILGALILTLPYATTDGQGTSWINALFTATSAVCVTGLVVVDTGTYYSTFGQLVILTLIEIGGLGFMTFATLFAIIMGRKITLKERILLQEALNQVSMEGIVRLTKYVIQLAFAIQGLGAILLTLRWHGILGWERAAYFGVFHSISAFNNAGFDLFGEAGSLTPFVSDIATNIIIMSLIIIGGLGFIVLSEIYQERGRKFHLHSKIVLKSTLYFIIIGTIIVFITEFNNPKTMGSFDSLSKLLASLFQSVTTRTAGFNTVSIGELRDTTLLFMMVFMFIGASPGSTGGGIKTTTFISVVLAVIASFKGKNEVIVRERTIPRDQVQKALAITMTGMLLIVLITALLSLTENADFLTVLFETTSAFGTVGLSMGLTPYLTPIGKGAIMFTMYVGRLGPLTLAFALGRKKKMAVVHLKYPEERILIG